MEIKIKEEKTPNFLKVYFGHKMQQLQDCINDVDFFSRSKNTVDVISTKEKSLPPQVVQFYQHD